MKTFFIKDNVCTPYKLILTRIHNFLVANGYKPINSGDNAEKYIVGCCGAFHSLENEAVNLIREAKMSCSEVIVFGCLPNISPEIVKRLNPDRIVPSPLWRDMEKLVENPSVPLEQIPFGTEFRSKEEYRLYDPGKQFILIQTGCSSDCPHCPHKLGIGNLESRPPEEIIDQVNILTKMGVETIVLHGNDTGSYGTDLGNTNYPDLLRKILPHSPDLHLTQINADWVYEYRKELFPLLRNPKIKEFQVLIQSSSNRLLKLMNRKPVVKDLYPFLKQLKNDRKDMFLRTDIIIGFPTAKESEEKETLEYVSDLFDEIAVHAFERFPHTSIEKMNLPFYSEMEIEKRVRHALCFFKEFPKILVHRGGQIIQTLVNIEEPKKMRRLELEDACNCLQR